MNDREIISLFFRRSESAIENTGKKYGRLLFSVAHNILSDSSDAEECVNDTYLALWNSIPPKDPPDLCAYICRTVKNFALKKYEYRHAAKRNAVTLPLDELYDICDSDSDVESICDTHELSARISEFLKSERKQSRVIFVRRYWFCDSVSEIAKRVGASEGSVKAQLFRTRERLRKYLEKEGAADDI